MTVLIKIMPNNRSVARDLPHGPLVVALLYDGLCTFEFGIVAEVFGLRRPEMGSGWYRFASCAIEQGPLRAHGGFTIQPDDGPELIDLADLIIVPGWKGASVPVPGSLCDQLRRAHGRGARLVSICSGAFVLAETGLLDGGTATTHWRYAETLRQRFPKVTVDAASLYREHDRVFTSAGSAAGIDLLIDIVRQDFGYEAANSVARRMVVPAHRSGGQAQFLERPVQPSLTGRLAGFLDEVRRDLSRQRLVDDMARHCRMSKRTFLRRFSEVTGTTPGEWLSCERIEAAKRLLSSTGQSLDEIAEVVGFGTPQLLRHHFRKRVGLTPSEFRSRFPSQAY